MKLAFVTKNKFKVAEISKIMEEFGIEIEQVAEEKAEPKEMSLNEVAKLNAIEFYKKLKRPVAVEDTGVFFKAYPEFPGNHPKLMFTLLGYKGLLKLIDGENREAFFRAVVGYCDENGYKEFIGELHGEIDTQVNDPDADVMPYERIFLFKGEPISRITREEKNRISHRSEAFMKLGEYLMSGKKV